jgi:predicted hydrocarbon binding protein
MKGIVFVEFLELVENKFGLDMVDDIIEEADLSTDGAYTSVGTYNHSELLQLVAILSKKVNIDSEELIRIFGEQLLTKFAKSYPQFFQHIDNCFDFLDTIENKVHVEVKKLYPEAELPTFDAQITDNGKTMNLTYLSARPLSALAYGLIQGSATYYGENITITTKDLSVDKQTKVIFTLQRT